MSILASMLNVSISNTRFNARSLGSDVQILRLTSMLTSIVDVIFDIDFHTNIDTQSEVQF